MVVFWCGPIQNETHHDPKTKSWCALFNCCKKKQQLPLSRHILQNVIGFSRTNKLFPREPNVDDHHHYLNLSSILVSTSQHCSKKQQKQVMTSHVRCFPTTFDGTIFYSALWNRLGQGFWFSKLIFYCLVLVLAVHKPVVYSFTFVGKTFLVILPAYTPNSMEKYEPFLELFTSYEMRFL